MADVTALLSISYVKLAENWPFRPKSVSLYTHGRKQAQLVRPQGVLREGLRDRSPARGHGPGNLHPGPEGPAQGRGPHARHAPARYARRPPARQPVRAGGPADLQARPHRLFLAVRPRAPGPAQGNRGQREGERVRVQDRGPQDLRGHSRQADGDVPAGVLLRGRGPGVLCRRRPDPLQGGRQGSSVGGPAEGRRRLHQFIAVATSFIPPQFLEKVSD